MKTKPPSPVIPAVMIMPDQVSFDCAICCTSHYLTRGLDFFEDHAGVWRLKEQPGYVCDCGAVLVGDFRLEAIGAAEPEQTKRETGARHCDVERDHYEKEGDRKG